MSTVLVRNKLTKKDAKESRNFFVYAGLEALKEESSTNPKKTRKGKIDPMFNISSKERERLFKLGHIV